MAHIRAAILELAEHCRYVLSAPPTSDGIEMQGTQVKVGPLPVSCLTDEGNVVAVMVGLSSAQHEAEEEGEVFVLLVRRLSEVPSVSKFCTAPQSKIT